MTDARTLLGVCAAGREVRRCLGLVRCVLTCAYQCSWVGVFVPHADVPGYAGVRAIVERCAEHTDQYGQRAAHEQGGVG